MVGANRFSIYPASFVHAQGTLNLRQIHSVNVQTGTKFDTKIPGGGIDPSGHVINYAEPDVTLATRDFDTLFGTVSVTQGLACDSGGTLRYQQRADGSAFQAGADHTTITMGKVYLVPTRISARQDDEHGASCDLAAHALWGGSTRPLVHNDGVTLGAPTPLFTSAYYLGPAYLGTEQIPGLVSTEIETGLTVSKKRTDGDPFARQCAVTRRAAMFKFSILKQSAMAGLDLFGRAASASLIAFFRKGINGGTRYADDTENHLKITAAAAVWGEESITVDATDDSVTTIQVLVTGTIALALSSTIP